MRTASIDELHILRGVLAASGQPSLVAADLSSLRIRASARPDVLGFAVDPASHDSRYATTAVRTTIGGPVGQPLAVAVTMDQYGKLYGIDVTDPSGQPLPALVAPGLGSAGSGGAASPSAVGIAGQLGIPGQAQSKRHGSLAIVGFIVSLFAFLNVVGLVLSIIALVHAKRTGSPRGFAFAGVLIGGAGVLVTVLIAAILGPIIWPMFGDAIETCNRLGIGEHQVGDLTYSCGYGSFRVTRSF